MPAPLAAAFAASWFALLLAAPFLPAAVSALTYAAASLVCHQLPDRSFHLDVVQLPVCARCLGIYAGCAAGALVTWLTGSPPDVRTSAWRRTTTRDRVLTAAALAPTAVTVALEWAGVWYPSNVARAIAGAPAGYVVAVVVVRALATVHYGGWAPRRPTAPSPPRSSI